MSTVFKRNIATLLLVSVFLIPISVYAQLDFEGAKTEAGKLGVSTMEVRPVIVGLINTLLGFVGIIAVAVIIYAGILYITSAGDENKAEKAKGIIFRAVVGLLLVGAAALIVNVVITAFGGSNGSS